MKQVTFRNGEILFNEGDLGRNMYKLLSGSVGVYANYGAPEEKQLTTLKPGAYLGEMAVIEAAPRSATAVALEDGTTLAEIDGNALDGLIREDGEELYGILRHLSSRLRELSGDYAELCGTLRELGRLDTAGEKVGEGLLSKLKKFKAVYLMNRKAADQASAEAARESSRPADGEPVRSETYRKGTVIFKEGETGNCLYDVQSGRVGIYANYGASAQKQLTVLVPGQFFGEMGLIEQLPRSATAVALDDDTGVELFFADDLQDLPKKRPEKVLAILWHLSHRLRRLTTDYLKACKTLAEAQEEIELLNYAFSPEAQAQLAYMTQFMLTPEIMF